MILQRRKMALNGEKKDNPPHCFSVTARALSTLMHGNVLVHFGTSFTVINSNETSTWSASCDNLSDTAGFRNFYCIFWAILGVFAKLRKTTAGIVMSVRPFVRTEQLGSQWTDFHES
jgi:hypothetical protein